MARLLPSDLEKLTGELASLSRSGIPIPEGLQALSTLLPASTLKGMAGELAAAVAAGKPLSQALASGPWNVPREYVAMIECIEATGDPGGVLEFAVEHSRQRRRIRGTLATAIVYPSIVLLVLIVVLFVFCYVVMPDFNGIYKSMGAELPFLTEQLVDLSLLLHREGGLALASGLGAFLLALIFSERLQSRLFAHAAWIPWLRLLVRLGDLAVALQFLGNMLGRGIPLPVALRACSLTVTQRDTTQSLLLMADAAERGQPVAPFLERQAPSTASYLFSLAEQRGTLARSCLDVSEYCESRFFFLSRHLTRSVEPLLVMGLGILIGLMMIAMYLPLFTIPRLVK